MISPSTDPQAYADWDAFVLQGCRTLSGITGAQIAPDISPALAASVLGTRVILGPNEHLLGVFDPSLGGRLSAGFAVTTQRLCWWEPPPDAFATSAVDTSGADAGRAGNWIAFGKLPERIDVAEGSTPALLLGAHQRIVLGPFNRDDLDALAHFLRRIRVKIELLMRHSQAAAAESHAFRPELVVVGDARNTARAEAVQFVSQMREATPRVVATRAITALCVGIFALMVLSGVSPIDPDAETLRAWGANFGPDVTVNHQYWRLASSMFLHFGILHIALNMWCLMSVGPLVERLFGNFTFAVLYLLSGIGGSIASLCYHPQTVSAGASGAVFGVIGGLLGFLFARKGTVPLSVLRPLRSSAFTFIGYNVLFGLSMPSIDNAAHLGGLATGFVCGLLLRRPWPPIHTTADTARRLGLGVLLVSSLGGILAIAEPSIRTRAQVVRKPSTVQAADAEALQAFQSFSKVIAARLKTFQLIANRSSTISYGLPLPRDTERTARDLDRLIGLSEESEANTEPPKTEHEAFQAMFDRVVSAERHQRNALRALRLFVDKRDESLIKGPEGYERERDAANKDLESFYELVQQFAHAHHLEARPE